MEKRGIPAYAAEFVGAFLLILFIGLILTSNSGGGLGFTDWAVIGLLHTLVLMVLVASLGLTSGAHFNPAVTVTMAALRRIGPADAAIYIVAQLAGGIAAALVVKLMLSTPADAVDYGATAINTKFVASNGAAFLAELVGTFALVWAIMGVGVNPRVPREWAPLVIGSALGFAVMAVGPFTGAGLNPARAFGPALVGDAFHGFGTFLFVYVAGPLVGGLLAGIGYEAIVLRPAGLAPGARLVDKVGG